MRGQPRGLQRHLDAPALAGGELLAQQGFDRLQGRELAALDAREGLLQSLQRARHLQPHQVTTDAIEGTIGGGAHAGLPLRARRLPTAS